MGNAEQEAEGRRAGVPITHYVHMNAGGKVFVKDADLFAAQGGHLSIWGLAWHGVFARDIEDARQVAEDFFSRRGATLVDRGVDLSKYEYRAIAHLINEVS